MTSSPTTTRTFLRVATLFGLAALLSGCATDTPQSTLVPAGPIAQMQLDLLMWSYWLSWIVIIGVFAVLIYVVVRFRLRKGEERMPTQFHGNTAMEIGLTIVPVVLVIAIAVPTVQTIFATENRIEPRGDDLVVNVTGYQFWWRFEYPELGVVTANELHVPVGRRIILNLNTADVIHAFWTPKLAGKRDMIPNQNNELWFVADEPGVYRGQCAEYCGVSHAYMRYQVVAETPEDFDRWKASFQEPDADAPEGDALAQRGREVFATRGCIGCHTVNNYADGYNVGSPDFPNLTNFGLRNTVGAGVLENTPENLARWIADPQGVKPGNFMPDLFAEDDPRANEEVEALVAYLKSLGTIR